MPKVKTVQTSMVAGEVTPRAFGRTDIEQYFSGCAELKNCYVTVQGGAFRREGLQYVANTNGNNASRLVSFEFNTVQTYLLVFQASRMDVYKDDSLVATVTTGDITNLTADIVSEMNFTQSADTLILVHKDLEPLEITRTSHTSWTVQHVTFDWIPQFPFGGVTQNAKTSTLSFTDKPGPNTKQLSATGEFASSNVGDEIIANDGIFEITEFIDADNVVCDILVEPSGFTNTTDWILETGYEDVWSASRGWPSAVTFFQGRLWLGGGSRPQTLWASKVGDFFNFRIASGDASDAIDITIDDDRVNAILNIFPGRELSIFTTGAEYFVRGGSLGEPITPSNVDVKRATLHGSEPIRPVSIDGSIFFIERGGAVVREFVFNDVEASFNANDISRLANHLIKSPTRQTVRNSTVDLPTPYLYMVSNDGNMTVVAISRQEKILAYTEFTTDGDFEDVVTVDKEVYVTTKRTVNSSTVRFIEKLNPDHFLDGSVRVDNGSATTSWSGFSHLNGETVEVRADDFVFANSTVSGGGFTTDDEATILEAGFGFAAKYKSLPLDATIGGGRTLTGDYKRLLSVNIRMQASRNLIVERQKTNGDTVQYKPPFRSFGSGVLDAPVSNFTGWKKVYLGGIDRDIQVTITQEEPLEFNLLSLNYEFGT